MGTALGLKRNGGIVCTQRAWSGFIARSFFDQIFDARIPESYNMWRHYYEAEKTFQGRIRNCAADRHTDDQIPGQQ